MAAMATTLSLAGRAPCAAPSSSSSSSICTTRAAAGASQQLGGFARRTPHSSFVSRAAGSGGIEPDLDDDNRDIWATAGEDMEHLFPYGKADGAHAWHEGEDGTWLEGIKEVIDSSGGPSGAQGAISWLYIPALIAGVYFDIPQDYLFLGGVLFIFAFIGMEMAKPSKESHFEPEMYQDK